MMQFDFSKEHVKLLYAGNRHNWPLKKYYPSEIIYSPYMPIFYQSTVVT